MTARQKALLRLKEAGKHLAIHEFGIEGVSENNLGTRLPEWAKEGLLAGRYRDGENFKEWDLTLQGYELAIQLERSGAEARQRGAAVGAAPREF